jgi:hypothetical protein
MFTVAACKTSSKDSQKAVFAYATPKSPYIST